jgi:RNA polymerase sigma-70 factor, ECF subfamily
MPTAETTEFTALLAAARAGDEHAGKELFAQVYQELRQIAQRYLRAERRDHTLQATALVHEVYLRLFAGAPLDLQNRAHFFAIAAQQMRQILVSHARHKRAQRRGGGLPNVSLSEDGALFYSPDEELLALDEALRQLAEHYPRAARVVELRYFGGLTEEEAAAALGISLTTLKRDWGFAKVWLLRRLRTGPA